MWISICKFMYWYICMCPLYTYTPIHLYTYTPIALTIENEVYTVKLADSQEVDQKFVRDVVELLELRGVCHMCII
jgi:hypothetical protein